MKRRDRLPHWTHSSSPDLVPQAGFYHQVIDKPGARWAETGFAAVSHHSPLHSKTQPALGISTALVEKPMPSCSLLWARGLVPGFALSLLELLKSPWKCVIKQERQRPAGRGRRAGKITGAEEYF